ncbi:MAG: 2OG-Fe(II) oxygenase [Myxococcales bacterium FL481]|nr:MAG: 2OG-Fe(II) oxygenase [Myxococcales bacterium FL481]
MRGETYIRIYDDVVGRDECKAWIEAFHASPFVGHGTAQQLGPVDRRFKVCDELYLREVLHRETQPDRRAQWKAIQTRLYAALGPYFDRYATEYRYLVGNEYGNEGFRFKRYPSGSGRFGLHYDATPGTPKRVFSLILYLCDVSEGGETEFPEQELKVSPKAGRLMIAPPFWTHPHRGNVPRSNDKYIVNTFATFK